jgi:UDP-N-acetylmuramoylalanine--D-glutamate ligase
MCALVKRKAICAVLYGEAAERFETTLRSIGYNSVLRVDDLDAAVPLALDAVKQSGGSVLLSPACASFDQYSGYESRGEHFKEIVARLKL